MDRIERLKQLVALDPESEVAQFGLGQAYLDAGKYAEAIAPLKKAIEIKPDYTAAYYALAGALEKVDLMNEAMQTYRKGIEIGEKMRDMIPLEKMRARLARLERGGPKPKGA